MNEVFLPVAPSHAVRQRLTTGAVQPLGVGAASAAQRRCLTCILSCRTDVIEGGRGGNSAREANGEASEEAGSVMMPGLHC